MPGSTHASAKRAAACPRFKAVNRQETARNREKRASAKGVGVRPAYEKTRLASACLAASKRVWVPIPLGRTIDGSRSAVGPDIQPAAGGCGWREAPNSRAACLPSITSSSTATEISAVSPPGATPR